MVSGRLDDATVAQLEAAEEVELRVALDGVPSRRPIWVVVVDGDAYVRSYLGTRGAWYRRLRHGAEAELALGGRILSVRLAPVDRGPIDGRVSAAYGAKYGDRMPGPTEAMLTPEAVATTLRVVGS